MGIHRGKIKCSNSISVPNDRMKILILLADIQDISPKPVQSKRVLAYVIYYTAADAIGISPSNSQYLLH